MVFLDMCPFDWTVDEAVTLHRTLYTAYPDAGSARFALQRAGIDTHEVNWSQSAVFFWKDALETSAGQSKLRELLTSLVREPRVRGYHDALRPLLEAEPPRPGAPPALAGRGGSQPAKNMGSRAASILDRLGALLDLDGHLTPQEREVLSAAAEIRAAAREGASLVPPGSGPVEREVLSRIASGAEGAEGADGAAATRPASGEGVRADLLSAIFLLAEGLLLDRACREEARAGLDEGSGTDAWAAALMDHVRVSRGVVTHVFRAGSTAAARVLDRWVVLRFDAHWRRVRGRLSRAGMAVTVASPEIVVSRGYRDIPAPVVKRMSSEARAFAREAAAFTRHLGETVPAVALQHLFPLPIATLASDLSIPAAADPEHELVLRRVDPAEDTALDEEIRVGQKGGRLRLSPGLLALGATYRWAIRCDYGTGDPAVITQGQVRIPSEGELHRCWAVKASPRSASRQAGLLEMGLHHEVLRELWPAVGHGASPGDLLPALRILEEGYEWLGRHAPESTQRDTLRDAGLWLLGHMEATSIP